MMPQLTLEEGEEISQQQQLNWERELLGIYLSNHPLEVHADKLATRSVPLAAITKDHDGRLVDVGGAINSIREITTKKGAKMAFVRFADLTAEAELIVFPKVYAQSSAIWQQDNVILAKAKADFSRNEELKLLVERVSLIDDESSELSETPAISNSGVIDTQSVTKRLYIRLEDSQNQPALLTLKEKLDGYAGSTEVVLVTGESAAKQIIKLPQTIDVNEQSLRELATIFGSTNVVVK
jgi:DNA polymerase-3 subunit alpha